MRIARSFSFAIFGLCVSYAPQASAQGSLLPWGQSSDQVGWETFVQVTAPSGIPGNVNVEFETWASDEDIYRTSPPKWPSVPSPKRLHPSVLNMVASARANQSASPRFSLEAITPGTCAPPSNPQAGDFPKGACIGEEVRRNWASFQYIVGNGLFSKSGLADAAKNGLVVNLPADSIEVKADWVRISDLKAWQRNTLNDDQIRKLYHVNTVEEQDGKTDYALVAFHFSTKQVKNWVWADFEHELNPGRCDDTGCHDSFGAVAADVPPKNSRSQNGQDINGNPQYGACAKSDILEKMMANAQIADVWRHYCLKGSQITFVNSNGSPTLLGNSVIERIAADIPILKSSCQTCHAYAAFNKTGAAGGFPDNAVGAFDPKVLEQAGMIQNDFIWGVLLAR
jgi:hypothetical protein